MSKLINNKSARKALVKWIKRLRKIEKNRSIGKYYNKGFIAGYSSALSDLIFGVINLNIIKEEREKLLKSVYRDIGETCHEINCDASKNDIEFRKELSDLLGIEAYRCTKCGATWEKNQ